MKDLNLNRMINVAAVGGLMLTVTGCGPSPTRASKQICKAMRECNKADFEDEYNGDLSECVEEQEEYFEYLEDEYSKGCVNAWSKYASCAAKAYQKECDYDDAEDECEDIYDEIEDECD